MVAQNFPSFWAGKGMKPMSSGFAPACFAAAWNWVIAQEPSHIVAMSPLASLGLEPSQLVVVGSFSVSPPRTMSYSIVSPTRRSSPSAHGSPSASLDVARGSQLTAPSTYVQCVSGHMSLKFV